MTAKDSSRQDLKNQVKRHWEREICGTRYGSSEDREEYFDEIYQSRYERTPYIREFARFGDARGKRVLEIGVGSGCDFRNWVENGARVSGIDLTEAAIRLTAEHLKVKGLNGLDDGGHELRTADAERLPFEDRTFDIVYSFGVLHHTPDTQAALAEAHRVLKPGGELRAMIFHVPSWTGFMLRVRYGLLVGRPFVSQKQAIFEWLESPGTKAYTLEEAKALAASAGFQQVSVTSRLCAGDFLNILPSTRYRGWPYRMVWRLYPRWLVALLGDRFGLNLLVRATASDRAPGSIRAATARPASTGPRSAPGPRHRGTGAAGTTRDNPGGTSVGPAGRPDATTGYS